MNKTIVIENETPVMTPTGSAQDTAGAFRSALALPRPAAKAIPTPALDIQAIKARQKATWESGDFGQVAKFTMPSAEEFMARIELEARHNVSPHAGETDTPSEYLEIHARVKGATGA